MYGIRQTIVLFLLRQRLENSLDFYFLNYATTKMVKLVVHFYICITKISKDGGKKIKYPILSLKNLSYTSQFSTKALAMSLQYRNCIVHIVPTRMYTFFLVY
jgi:hypothetical protein